MKRKMFVLAALAALTAGMVACGMSTTGGDPHEEHCSGVLRKFLVDMRWNLNLICKYQMQCDAEMTYDGGIARTAADSNYHYCRAEYEFYDGKTRQSISFGTTVPVVVDDDDHVRFSLFDETNAEKSYDIDLSEIIHSYTTKGDSVEIKMPENNFRMTIDCPYCVKRDYSDLCAGTYACQYRGGAEENPVVVGIDSLWGRFFTFHQYLGGQSSMGGDSIKVYGDIYWR